MAFKIAIASGKGGTGKTTFAVNLFSSINEHWTRSVQLIDCDVEEPNDLLFFRNFYVESEKLTEQVIPKIDTSKCTFCKKCEEYCEFNAIVMIPSMQYAVVNKDLCHSCGACFVACQFDAIYETTNAIGTVTNYNIGNDLSLMEGNLRVGSPLQTMLIKDLKKNLVGEHDILIYDAPPGTSCPVVETISDADFVILVTEPTPFGVYDLKLTVDLLREVNKPFGVFVNKAGLGDSEVYEFLKAENIDLLGEIPFSKEYAGLYAKGKIVSCVPLQFAKEYCKVVEYLKKLN
ncbi:ATP-binding protein [Labilibaculum sp. K2S]|uniref:ATP-binding protein n=1 Tax=Labilibaculum sp. K2S TaxID=3056386 RepID=UPI0025A41BBD|nr:ATP-binding protein [Labilibaculum sp. K2S]MDM8158567.1 ATP-binding protein [Labilibaculum sp. K2S]